MYVRNNSDNATSAPVIRHAASLLCSNCSKDSLGLGLEDGRTTVCVGCGSLGVYNKLVKSLLEADSSLSISQSQTHVYRKELSPSLMSRYVK